MKAIALHDAGYYRPVLAPAPVLVAIGASLGSVTEPIDMTTFGIVKLTVSFAQRSGLARQAARLAGVVRLFGHSVGGGAHRSD
jgi:hypothetical protein